MDTLKAKKVHTIPQAPEGLEGFVMTETDVAGMLHVSAKTINRYFKAGKIKAFRVGNKWRTLRTHVDTFLSQS